MPANNPYDFAGSFSGGALGGSSSGPASNAYGGGSGSNPYGGYLSTLLQQRQKREQATEADTMSKLRAIIASIAAGQAAPQGGALSVPAAEARPAAPQQQETPIGTYAPSEYIAKTGGIESSNDYTVVNPASGAGGKYQFIEPTWKAVSEKVPGLTPEGRTSNTPEGRAQQEAAMRYLSAENANSLKQTLGRMPTHAELYIAHLLGSGYGGSVLKQPETPVEALVPESFVKANPFLKGLSGRQLVQMFAKKYNP